MDTDRNRQMIPTGAGLPAVNGGSGMVSGLMKGSVGKATSLQFPIEVISEAINYFRTREIELTKRALISSTREIEIERIRAGRRAFEHFITAEYATRREAITALSRMLSIAQQSGFTGQFSEILAALNGLIVRSPLNEDSLSLLAGSSKKTDSDGPRCRDHGYDSSGEA